MVEVSIRDSVVVKLEKRKIIVDIKFVKCNKTHLAYCFLPFDITHYDNPRHTTIAFYIVDIWKPSIISGVIPLWRISDKKFINADKVLGEYPDIIERVMSILNELDSNPYSEFIYAG